MNELAPAASFKALAYLACMQAGHDPQQAAAWVHVGKEQELPVNELIKAVGRSSTLHAGPEIQQDGTCSSLSISFKIENSFSHACRR